MFFSNQKYRDTNAPKSSDYESPKTVGKIESNDITEASGLAASKCQPNVFWTHNDSGDEAFIFAISESGENLGTYQITGAKNIDWEDIAEFKTANGQCILYVGDIGNNQEKREEMTIYAVAEPKVTDSGSSSNRKNPIPIESPQTIKFVYPDSHHNAETLMVHPQTGDVYVLSKRMDGPAGIYKLKSGSDLTKTNRLEKIGDISVPAVPNGYLTGGSIAPDGRHLMICDYLDGYELTLPGGAKNFDEIWKQTPKVIDLGEREQGEAVSYSADGKAVYAVNEGKHSPVIRVNRK